VLAAVVAICAAGYAARFRILPTSDSLAALSTLEELALAEDPVALIVADQRMPALSGTDLLTQVADSAPRRPRRPADRVHRHRRDRGDQQDPPRPVHPQAVGSAGGEPLSVLDELLDDWEAGFHPPFDGIRLVGQLLVGRIAPAPGVLGPQPGAVPMA
jgi:thioredoxin reductase (NADPH)